MCELTDESLTHLVIANGVDGNNVPTGIPSRTHIVKQQVLEELGERKYYLFINLFIYLFIVVVLGKYSN